MWPAIRLTRREMHACGLTPAPLLASNEIYDEPKDSTSSQPSSYHVGCPLTRKYVCSCNEFSSLVSKVVTPLNEEPSQMYDGPIMSASTAQYYQDEEAKDQIRSKLVTQYNANNLQSKVTPAILEIDVSLELERQKIFSQHNGMMQTTYVPQDYPRSEFQYPPKSEERRTKRRSWPPESVVGKKYNSKNRKRKKMEAAAAAGLRLANQAARSTGNRTCAHCRVTDTPLWRKGWKSTSTSKESPHPPATTASLQQGSALAAPVKLVPQLVDLCNICYLQWNRGTLKKKSDKKKKKKKGSSITSDNKIIDPIRVSVTSGLPPPAVSVINKGAVPKPPKVISAEREAELRGSRQFCPICNAVYEDDDDHSFIFCDACDMWIHSTCDTTLDSMKLDQLALTNAKYVCPSCSKKT